MHPRLLTRSKNRDKEKGGTIRAKRMIAGIGIGAGVVGLGLLTAGVAIGGGAAMLLTPKDGPSMRRAVGEKVRRSGERAASAGRTVGRRVGSIVRLKSCTA
jgi:gas vesicle protein